MRIHISIHVSTVSSFEFVLLLNILSKYTYLHFTQIIINLRYACVVTVDDPIYTPVILRWCIHFEKINTDIYVEQSLSQDIKLICDFICEDEKKIYK